MCDASVFISLMCDAASLNGQSCVFCILGCATPEAAALAVPTRSARTCRAYMQRRAIVAELASLSWHTAVLLTLCLRAAWPACYLGMPLAAALAQQHASKMYVKGYNPLVGDRSAHPG
jgi:hypothetical protein